jgi:precorrin-2 methylase
VEILLYVILQDDDSIFFWAIKKIAKFYIVSIFVTSKYALYSSRFQKQDGVVLMATTRNINQIDEALQRPGRMDRVFYLQQPTQAEREKILHLSAKETMDEDLIDFVDWRKVIPDQCCVCVRLLANAYKQLL